MYFSVLLLPFLSFFTTNLFGRFLGTHGCRLFSTTSVFLSFLLSIIIFFEIAIANSPCILHVANWFHVELFFVC